MMGYYYELKRDIEKYPDAWAYMVWGGRNTGKTYSALSYMLELGCKFVFVKRTIEDCKLIISGSGKIGTKISSFGADFSPFKAINRDKGTQILPFSIYEGYIGGFWSCSESKPVGEPIGYLTPLSAVSKVKGFDLSECDFIIFDEFIPSPWEKINREEGKQLLDLYMTIARDREHRGRKPLKLVCLANPTQVNCPVLQELEIADDASEMSLLGEEYRYKRGILMHQLRMSKEFIDTEEEMPAVKAMEGTAWRATTMGEGFAYNEMGMIKRVALKGFRCCLHIIYRKQNWYLYEKEGLWYVCKSVNKPTDGTIDLNKDADIRKFYMEYVIDLKEEYIDGRVLFQTYTMYDVIINYKKFFKF